MQFPDYVMYVGNLMFISWNEDYTWYFCLWHEYRKFDIWYMKWRWHMAFIACDMYTGNASEISGTWNRSCQVPEIVLYHIPPCNKKCTEIPGFPALWHKQTGLNFLCLSSIYHAWGNSTFFCSDHSNKASTESTSTLNKSRSFLYSLLLSLRTCVRNSGKCPPALS